MKPSEQLAKHFREVYFGGNWTSSSLEDNLADLNWKQATTQVYSLNTIVALVYHINYYVTAVTKVLQGESLDAKDKYSFDHPPILSPDDWTKMQEKLWADAKTFLNLIEALPEDKLCEDFSNEKYGTYYRNIQGVIEHIHYHLGQIVLIKKILQEKNGSKSTI